MPRDTRLDHGSLSLSDRIKLSRLYRQGRAAYGSIANLTNESKLPRKKILEFLHSRPAYTKYKKFKRKFKRLKASARFKNDIWCIDLAQVDKLATWNDNVRYLLVAVDVFSRFVRVKTMLNKSADEAKKAFSKMLVSGVRPNKVWIDRGTEFAGSFKNYCMSVNIDMYHTYSETKASYAERAIQSLKNIMYRYMENMETDRYVDQLGNFVKTINSRFNRSIRKAPEDVKNSDFLRVMYGGNDYGMTHTKHPRYQVGDIVRLAKVDKPFKKGYKPQFTDELFLIHKIATKKPIVTYNIKDMNNDPIQGKFYENELTRQIINHGKQNN